MREGHAPVDVAHTRMARRRTNQYRTVPGAHPNRRDRQSASTRSAINHTFRYYQLHLFNGGKASPGPLYPSKLSSSPAYTLPVARSQRWQKNSKGTRCREQISEKKFNLDKIDGETIRTRRYIIDKF